MIERPSPNHDARPKGQIVDILVLHYTGMKSAAAALDRMCDPAAKVSAHYMIDEDGTVYHLVDEGACAWHAGEAFWRGGGDINARSIGIELVNPGHEFGLCAFPPAQMTALAALARDIIGRHGIPTRNVVGHADVAPRRKCDPGEMFDWAVLAADGVGLWPGDDGTPVSPDQAATAFGTIGYEVEDMVATVTAFQRRFRPSRVDGVLDQETRARIAAVLAAFTA